MKNKAVKLLEQFRDSELFQFLSEGISHIFDNAMQIETAADDLRKLGRIRGARVLRLFAEEEAAKILILMDLVRCKRSTKEFSRQLAYFYDHLAKKIYAWSCISQQGDFLSARETIEFSRKEHLLHPGTGEPLSADDQLPDEREGALYIDCFEEDGELKWITPTRIDEIYQRHDLPQSNVILLTGALVYAWFTKPESLAIIADLWREINMQDGFHRSELEKRIDETALELGNSGLLSDEAEECLPIIRELWFFPLHSLELRKVSKNEWEKEEHPFRYEL